MFYRKRISIFGVFLCALFLVASVAGATEGDSIRGIWLNEDKDARIDIFRCDNKYCGKIIWLEEPYYTAEDKEGKRGEPRTDTKNPDPALRKRPILGLQILHDFTYAGGNRWTGGKVYDPKNGRTYSGTLTLASPNQLYMRGFVGISLFGRTTTWTRSGRE